MSEPNPIEQREVLVRGMVQGVGFRYTTRRIAARYAVTGYVQNLPEGSVRLVAEGSSSELNRFLSDVKNQFGGAIESMDVTLLPARGKYPGFEIRP